MRFLIILGVFVLAIVAINAQIPTTDANYHRYCGGHEDCVHTDNDHPEECCIRGKMNCYHECKWNPTPGAQCSEIEPPNVNCQGGRPSAQPTVAAATEIVHISQTIAGGYVITCTKEGYQPHPTDTHKYIQCEYIADGPSKGWWIHIMPCAPGSSWNQKDEKCDNPPL